MCISFFIHTLAKFLGTYLSHPVDMNFPSLLFGWREGYPAYSNLGVLASEGWWEAWQPVSKVTRSY